MTSRDPKPDAEALMPCKGHQSGSATVANGAFGLQLVFVDELMDERGYGRSGQSCHLCEFDLCHGAELVDAGQQVGAVCLAKRGLRTEKPCCHKNPV